MTVVRDNNGRPMRLVLMQVDRRDAQGRPLILRMRHDDGEKIDLSVIDQPTFYMVWTAGDELAETSMAEMVDQIEKLKKIQAEHGESRVAMGRDIARVEADLERLTKENEEKTIELRLMRRERDPEYVARHAREHADKVTTKLNEELATARAEAAGLRSELAAAVASKKKLRDALERLKEKR